MPQLTLDPNADGHFTAWTNTFANVDDGATADDDTTYVDTATNGARESFYVPNVTSGQIPDGATINWVEIQTRTRKAVTQAATFVHGVYKGTGAPDINEDGTEDTLAQTYGDFTHQLTTDPFTAAAWDVATLRGWASGGATPRSFGIRAMAARAMRCTRLRVVVDYNLAATPNGSQPAPTGALVAAARAATLSVVLKQGATVIASGFAGTALYTDVLTSWELQLTQSEIANIVAPANNLTVEISSDLYGGAISRVFEVTLILPAAFTGGAPNVPLSGTQPAASGYLHVLQFRALSGTEPAPSGILLVNLYKSLTGTQPAPTGTLRKNQSKAYAGTQPPSTGNLQVRQFLKVARTGAQPAPTGALAARKTLFRSLTGAQPAPSGALVRRQSLFRALAGTQPAPTGALRTYRAVALAGAQPAPAGSAVAVQILIIALDGTEPAPAGTLVVKLFVALGGSQPPPSGTATAYPTITGVTPSTFPPSTVGIVVAGYNFGVCV